MKLRMRRTPCVGTMDDVQDDGLSGHIEDGGLVHVVPESLHSRSRQHLKLFTPPGACVGLLEIRKCAYARPYLAEVCRAVRTKKECVAGKSRPVRMIRGVGLDTRVHDRCYRKPVLCKVGEQPFGIGKIFLAPREDAIAFHVIDVEIQNIARYFLRSKC